MGDGEDFIKSDKFDGAKAGYVFKSGSSGVVSSELMTMMVMRSDPEKVMIGGGYDDEPCGDG